MAISKLVKIDSEAVAMNTNFAVQVLKGESYKDVSKVVLTAAHNLGILFRKLQVMEVFSIGTTPFVRFRSDVSAQVDEDTGTSPLKEILATLKGRSIVASEAGDYVVNFSTGKRGKYQHSVMCAAHRVGFGQVYSGPKLLKWDTQFI